MNTSGIQQRINESFNETFLHVARNDPRPLVCVICDRFIQPSSLQILSIEFLSKHQDQLHNNNATNLTEELEKYYTVNYILSNDSNVVSNCLLSPGRH
jgi:hypothetical protein